jgi:hypothetical protein
MFTRTYETRTITLPVFNVRLTLPMFVALLALATVEVAVEVALVVAVLA